MAQGQLFLCLLLLSYWKQSEQCPDGQPWEASSAIANKCYLVVQVKAGWIDAEQYCRNVSSDGHLTSCTSAFENHNIVAVVENTAWVHHSDQFWIGANDQGGGQFQWTDQQSFVYRNWDSSQPDSRYGCVSLQVRTGGRWSTQPCTNTSYFVCETYMNASDTTTTASTITTTLTTTNQASSMSIGPSSASTQLLSTFTTTATTTPASASSAITTTTTAMSPSTTTTTPSSPLTNMTDCFDWLHIGGQSTSGVYQINPGGIPPFNVYCDMDTDGGGWTLIQRFTHIILAVAADMRGGRRLWDNSTVYWNQPWLSYKSGFNNGGDKNFWLGLDRVNVLSTKDSNVQLRIDLTKNRCPSDTCGNSFDSNGQWFGVWKFSIDNEANKYQLHVGMALNGSLSSSDAYDPFFSLNNNQPFTTIDADNDNWDGGNCASDESYKFGGWWHNSCGKVCLNGVYDPPAWATSGISYYRSQFADDYWIVPVTSEMKLRKQTASSL